MCLAVPSKVVEVDEANKTGRIDHLGAKIKANFALLDSVKVGDWVIVHAGFAIAKLDEADAKETLDLLREIADLGA
jgi:hydrogenase expression/formation protein HypC